MADSDKDILITPSTGVATTHPKMTFTGKDNSPIDLKILDDNSLSFEGVQGQVFSISPILNSGDIFSVNDISGVQSIAVNADGTISMNAQTKSVTITNSASNISNLILENTNADEVDGPILEFYRNTASPADGGDAGTLLFTGQDDGGNKQEYGRITMEFDDVSNSAEEGELIFRLTEAGAVEQEYMRLRGSTRQIEFNTGTDDIDLVWNSDSASDVFYCNAGTSRIGIGTSAPETLLHIDNGTLQIGLQADDYFTALGNNSLQFNRASTSYIDQSGDGGHISFRMNGTNLLWLDGAGKVGIGNASPNATLHVEGGANDEVVAMFTTAGGTSSSVEGIAHIGLSHFSSDTVPSVSLSAEENGTGSHLADFRINTRASNSANAVPTEKVRVTHDGKVGIGTTTPEDKLHISAGNIIFDTSGQQSSSNFAAHSKILFRDESDSTTRTMAGIGAERTAWSNSPHDLVFYTGNLSGSSSEDFDESTEKLRITDTGSIKTPLGNLNTCVVFGYNRTDMDSGAVSLKALVVESASTQNVWGHVMPKSGRIKMFAIRTNNHTVTGTNAQTWKINRNNQNGGTAGTDHFQIAVAKGATQNDTGVTGNATMELTATAHSNTIWKGSVVTNLAFSAGEEIRIQRTNANNVDMGDVSGQLYVEFD